MNPINQKALTHFLEKAGDRLTGDWVIIGGSVLALVGAQYRVTNDIDLAGPEEATQKDNLLLMEIAEELGFPVETINQAGAFFLSKIPQWKKMIVLHHKGKKAAFYRPNATLYVLLKMPRLTESDLTDCLKLMELYPQEIDSSLLLRKLEQEMSKADGQKTSRLSKLRTATTDKNFNQP